MDIRKEYERWLANATADADVVAELKSLDDAKIEDAFYRDLAFGTGGLRGVIGAGTNRMNVYTVAKASQGLADYLKKNFAEPSGSSPAENPPGNIIICDWLIAFSNSSTDSLMLAASRFLNTLTIVSAPALSNALALSYSQLVPGNTGINTVGFATLFLHT